MAFKRHFRWFPCAWFAPCLENVTVFEGTKQTGKVIGRVTQPCCGGCCTPKLNVLNGHGDRELLVKGPCCWIGSCKGERFDILADTKARNPILILYFGGLFCFFERILTVKCCFTPSCMRVVVSSFGMKCYELYMISCPEGLSRRWCCARNTLVQLPVARRLFAIQNTL